MHTQIFLEHALGVRQQPRAAHEAHVDTQVLAPGRAIAATPARPARIGDDAVTDGNAPDPITDPVADLYDVAGHLVAEHERLAHPHLADPALEIVVQVGAADAADSEFDAHGTGRKRTVVVPVLDTQTLGGMQHACFHCISSR